MPNSEDNVCINCGQHVEKYQDGMLYGDKTAITCPANPGGPHVETQPMSAGKEGKVSSERETMSEPRRKYWYQASNTTSPKPSADAPRLPERPERHSPTERGPLYEWISSMNGYMDAAETEIARLREALEKINHIRQSIVGLQTINWSEHIYPLVAALDEAGCKTMEYGEARTNFGTMLERTNRAEAKVSELERQLARANALLEGERLGA